MRGIDAVPERLDCGVRLAHHHDAEIPIRQPLAKQPARRLGTNVDGALEPLSQRLRPRLRRPGEAVDPLPRRVWAKTSVDLVFETGRAARRRHAGIVRAPIRQAARILNLGQVAIRQIERHRPHRKLGDERTRWSDRLTHLIGARIEGDGGPAAAVVRRKPGADMLPGQSRILGLAVVEIEARRPVTQPPEVRQVPLRHQGLSERYLESVEPYHENAGYRGHLSCLAADGRPASSTDDRSDVSD